MATQAQIQEALRFFQASGQKVSKVKEEYPSSKTSGDSVGMTGNPRSDYAQRFYRMPDSSDTNAFPDTMTQLMDSHDRISYVLGLECGPTIMEARRRFGEEVVKEAKEYQKLQEAGAKFSAETTKHLLKAHDGIARSIGASCDTSASPQERLLKQHQQTLKQMQETHNQRMQELMNLAKPKTFHPATNYPTHKNYIQEKVVSLLKDGACIDRSCPWPEWMNSERGLERALGELQNVYLGLYDAQHGLTADGPTGLFG